MDQSCGSSLLDMRQMKPFFDQEAPDLFGYYLAMVKSAREQAVLKGNLVPNL